VGEKLEAIIDALDKGMSKSAVCSNFASRTTLIETMNCVGWPEGTEKNCFEK
jgi:hypothetical protein